MSVHSIEGKTVLIAGGAKNLGGLIARDFDTLPVTARALVDHLQAALATEAQLEHAA